MSTTPEFKVLERIRTESTTSRQWYAGATFMHPNPRFFKYYWWVFWKESPVEGEEFPFKRIPAEYGGGDAVVGPAPSTERTLLDI